MITVSTHLYGAYVSKCCVLQLLYRGLVLLEVWVGRERGEHVMGW